MKNKRITILAAALATVAYVGATAAEAETIPERLIEDLQSDFGFEDFQAAGIAGNLARETGNFRYLQELNPIVRNSRGGLGYAQWTGPRRRAYESWLEENNYEDPTAYEANYGFLVHELNEDYARVVAKMEAAETVEQASRIFMTYFLGPHPDHRALDERIAYAEKYLEGDFSGAGCQSVHQIYGDSDMLVVAMCPEPTPMPDFQMAGDYVESDIEAVLADLVGYGPLENDLSTDPITAARMIGVDGPLDDQLATVLVQLASYDPSDNPSNPFMTAEVSYDSETVRYEAPVSAALVRSDEPSIGN